MTRLRRFIDLVWQEIVIGFTIAGFVAVLVPAALWARIFLTEAAGSLPSWLVVLENAADMKMDMEGGGPVKRAVVYFSIAVLAGGLVSPAITSW